VSGPDLGEDGGDRRILIVDDDALLLAVMGEIARGAGFRVETLSEGGRLLDAVAGFRPGCIVMDLSIPDIDGVEILKALAASGCGTPIVIVSSHPAAFLEDVRRLGGALGLTMRAVLEKPFATSDFLAAIGGS